jgi:histidinol-phosphate/aromatic aminotransferase/cobyric acid decarboxylase-like protein
VNQEPMSPHVKSSIAQYATTLPTVAHQYPKWDVTKDRLLERISSGLGDVDNKMSAANIILTNGSDNALKLLLEAFAHSEEILIVTPTYPHFVSFAENMHTQIHYFDCLQLEKEEWMNSSILLTAVSREIDLILQRTVKNDQDSEKKKYRRRVFLNYCFLGSTL